MATNRDIALRKYAAALKSEMQAQMMQQIAQILNNAMQTIAKRQELKEERAFQKERAAEEHARELEKLGLERKYIMETGILRSLLDEYNQTIDELSKKEVEVNDKINFIKNIENIITKSDKKYIKDNKDSILLSLGALQIPISNIDTVLKDKSGVLELLRQKKEQEKASLEGLRLNAKNLAKEIEAFRSSIQTQPQTQTTQPQTQLQTQEQEPENQAPILKSITNYINKFLGNIVGR